jgi:hypothetical protein
MDADEQISLHAPRLVHTDVQRHKKIGVARHVGPHGVAFDLGCVDALAQPVCDLQHHVLFLCAIGADGAGVFPAMARVQRHDDEPVGRRCGGNGLG